MPSLSLNNSYGDPTSISSGEGYSLSYSGPDKDRLMGKEAYQSGDFPGWMQGGAPIGALQNYRKNLGQFYNFGPIQNSYNQLAEQQRSAMGASTAAAANAATNRAMLAGGRVGAGFAQASAMLPMMRAQASQNLELGALQAQMMNQKSQAALQAAQAVSGMRQQTQGMRQNYAVDAARLAQQNIGASLNNNTQLGYGGSGSGGIGRSTRGQGQTQMTPGYIGNAGSAVNYATINGQPLQGHVLYPGAMGALGGRISA